MSQRLEVAENDYEWELTPDEGSAARAARLRLHARGWRTSWALLQQAELGTAEWRLRAVDTVGGRGVVCVEKSVGMVELRAAWDPAALCQGLVARGWEQIEAEVGQPEVAKLF